MCSYKMGTCTSNYLCGVKKVAIILYEKKTDKYNLFNNYDLNRVFIRVGKKERYFYEGSIRTILKFDSNVAHNTRTHTHRGGKQ